jgi:alkylation response protein AidB-like acyl-CoA dehydrogenase
MPAMDFSLTPLTEPGRSLVALAEGHREAFFAAAGENDKNARFPQENIDALLASGVLSACVPQEFGGLGVESVHDFAAGMNRLGRGDGSTALAANMHVSQTWLLAWYWRGTRASGYAPSSEALAGHLKQIVDKRLLMCSAVAEAGTDILHPQTEVHPVGGGWRLTGRKMFGTLSPAAQVFEVTCKIMAPEGPRFGVATVPRTIPGVEVQGNWDAMGMRASGSHDVVFQNCPLPPFAVADLGPWGEWGESYLAGNIVITLGLVAALTKPVKRGKAPAERPSVRHVVAEMEIDLAASRAMLARTALTAGEYFGSHFAGSCPMDELHALMKDFQCTKQFVGSKAVQIVDRAMTATGGGAYLTRNPLSRLYRDVRAGSFMQPFSPNEGFEYIGRVTLGLDPTVWD